MAKQLHSAGFVIFKETLNSVAYLLLHNVKGHWDFPKGLIEEGEEPLAAAKREAKEAADLTHLEVIEGFHEKVSEHMETMINSTCVIELEKLVQTCGCDSTMILDLYRDYVVNE